MAESLDTKHTITKLNNSNYQVWKFKVKMLLIRDGIWSVVNGDRPEPIPESWNRKDEKAQCTISLTVEDNQLIHIYNCNSARDMWMELQKVHERANLSSKMYLRKKLYKMKLQHDQNMQEYISETLQLVEQLRGVGEEVTDPQVATLLLCGLPDDYETLITALEARDEDELTLEYVKNKLVDAYKRKKNCEADSAETKTESALYSGNSKPNYARNSRYDSQYKDRETRSCFVCKKPGHLKKDCRIWKARMKQEEDKKQNNSKQPNLAHKAKSAIVTDLDSSDIDESIHGCFKIDDGHVTNDWFIDSGATAHMTNNKNFFTTLDQSRNDHIYIANGTSINAAGVGDGYLDCIVDDGIIRKIEIKDVLYAPTLTGSLLSVKKLTKKGNKVQFIENECYITKGDKVLAVGKLEDNLYKLLCKPKADIVSIAKSEVKHQNCVHLWHRRLGHRDPNAIKRIRNEDLASGINIDNCDVMMKCEHCIKGKATQKSYPEASLHRAKQPLDLIHSDVCGPMKTLTPGKNKYMVTFIDDFSRYTTCYLIQTKDEVPDKFREFIAEVSNKFQRKVKTLRSDNGGEYTGNKLINYLKLEGIQLQTSVPYSPSQNGVAERKNRSIVEMAKCMLLDAGLPQQYWGEAVMTAVYLQNRLPTKSTEKTPFELWHDEKPDLSHIRIFGCKAFAFVPKEKRTKFDDHATETVLVGYSEQSKGYRLLQTATNRIIISRSVTFDEGASDSGMKTAQPKLNCGNSDETLEVQSTDNEINEIELRMPQEVAVNKQDSELKVNQPRRSARSTKGVPPTRLSLMVQSELMKEPSSWKEMILLPENEQKNWIKAAEEEINAHRKNGTWMLCDPPVGKTPIDCKWVFKLKHDANGNACRHKARLVAKGFTQKFGQDYDDTFAPVARHTTLRTLLTVAASKKLQVRHYDVKTAFLNGDISEDLYMVQPEGFIKPGEEHKVCQLKEAIYGLKQSARNWNQKIDFVLKENGFRQSEADQCLYIKKYDSAYVYILLYVDDLLLCGCTELIKTTADILNQHFEVKDLGEVSLYLGIEIARDSNGHFVLSQTNKIRQIIAEFGLSDANGCTTPMNTEYLNITEDEKLLDSNEQYRKAVGALLYVAITTRPDISAAVSILCRKVSSPRQCDWTAVKRVIRYLKQTVNMQLKLCKDDNLKLIGYVDADWAGDKTDRKSTSGYLFQLGKATISWTSKKQESVALSSTEAEYIAAATASQEMIWLRQLLSDLQVPIIGPTVMYEDNQGCIKLACNEKSSARTKHIDVRHHHLRDLQARNIIDLKYCASDQMLADVMTKPLARHKLNSISELMGLCNNIN
jgi:transposase InsO family protein